MRWAPPISRRSPIGGILYYTTTYLASRLALRRLGSVLLPRYALRLIEYAKHKDTGAIVLVFQSIGWPTSEITTVLVLGPVLSKGGGSQKAVQNVTEVETASNYAIRLNGRRSRLNQVRRHIQGCLGAQPPFRQQMIVSRTSVLTRDDSSIFENICIST